MTLYDMDSFRMEETSEKLSRNLEAAGKIVREQMEEFRIWYEGRTVIPRIQEIREEAVRDFHVRIEKIIKHTPMESADREELQKTIDKAAGKVINKMMFGLKDFLNEEAFLECVAGLEKLYEN